MRHHGKRLFEMFVVNILAQRSRIPETMGGDDVRMKGPSTTAQLHALHSIFRGLVALAQVEFDPVSASKVWL